MRKFPRARERAEHASVSHLLQLLETAHDGGHRRVGKARLPVGDADLADVDVACGVERETVRGEEFADRKTGAILAAEARNFLSLSIHDGQARPDILVFEVDRHAGTELADDEVRFADPAAAAQRAGTMQIIPLRLVLALAVE